MNFLHTPLDIPESVRYVYLKEFGMGKWSGGELWGIETSLYWCLDIAFREDESRIVPVMVLKTLQF